MNKVGQRQTDSIEQDNAKFQAIDEKNKGALMGLANTALKSTGGVGGAAGGAAAGGAIEGVKPGANAKETAIG